MARQTFDAGRGAAPAAPVTPVAPAAPVTPVAPAAPSGFSQLLRGQYSEAQQNPLSSQFTVDYAKGLERLEKENRAAALARKPTWEERSINYIGGDRISDAAIDRRTATAEALGHPLVQQFLIKHPNELDTAERDPHRYAQKLQNPVFQKFMQQELGIHDEVEKNPKVHPDHQQDVKNVMRDTGAGSHHVNALFNPRAYTPDEFAAAVRGMPLQAIELLFGKHLQHVATPQEKVAGGFFTRLYGDYDQADALVKELEKDPVNSQTPWFGLGGKSKTDAAREERAKRAKAIQDHEAQYIGASGKIVP